MGVALNKPPATFPMCRVCTKDRHVHYPSRNKQRRASKAFEPLLTCDGNFESLRGGAFKFKKFFKKLTET